MTQMQTIHKINEIESEKPVSTKWKWSDYLVLFTGIATCWVSLQLLTTFVCLFEESSSVSSFLLNGKSLFENSLYYLLHPQKLACQMPKQSAWLEPFLYLSYQSPNQKGFYQKGMKDVLFVLGWMGLLFLLQHSFNLMAYYFFKDRIYVSRPKTTEAKLKYHNEHEEKMEKFCEQSFLFCYYICSITAGIFLWIQSPYFFLNFTEFWTDYPVWEISAYVKNYYLIQASFWLLQLSIYIFMPIQQRRKDHWAMTAHHVITSLLIICSYMAHFTRVGNMVLITMDAADVFLCLAKSLKYLGPKYQRICDFMFGLFAFTWLWTRHGLYFMIVHSIYYQALPLIKLTPWDPYYFRPMKTQQDLERPGTYFSIAVWIWFLWLFAALQSLLIYWFLLIIKVIRKVLSGSSADDVREDD